MRKSAVVLLSIFCIFGMIGCNDKDNTNNKVNVTVSTQVLKEFTEKIGGDKVNVENLVSGKNNISSYKITKSDINKVKNSDVFIYNGAGLENYIDKLKSSVSKVELVDSSKSCNIIYEDKKPNPYYYLSPLEAEKQCSNILKSLIKADNKNKDYYEKNYDYFIEDLKAMYDTYKEKFSSKGCKYFVSSNGYFDYICRDFALENKTIESNDSDYKEISEFCSDYGLKVIFYCGDSKISKEVAEKIGGEVKELYDYSNYIKGKSYIEVMNENLTSIYFSC